MISRWCVVVCIASSCGAAHSQGVGAAQIGGSGNSAPGAYSAEFGGFSNIASGDASAVVGGGSNSAGLLGSVLGGRFNQAAEYASIGGGYANVAGVAGHVGGGAFNTAGGFAVVGGGFRNSASGVGSFIGGGGDNLTSGTGAAVLGGGFNSASGDFSAVLSGTGNRAVGTGAVVVAGKSAVAAANGSVVIADQGAAATNAVPNSVLLSFSGGIITSGTLTPVGVAVIDVTRPENVGAVGQLAPAPMTITLPQGHSNVVRLLNTGFDITTNAGNFNSAFLTRNQMVVVDSIVPVAAAGTRVLFMIDCPAIENNVTQRKSLLIFRDSVTGDNLSTGIGGNLNLGRISSYMLDLDPNGPNAGNFGTDFGPLSLLVDANDVIEFVSDGTMWREVRHNTN